ncbi:hypothetical protein VTN77DRAFT_5324 [Rasamsonia byssochlamydoides]|uniref:uncharacterized protein n=1 Tax=Rasamsonia byssochlamydoides TaxID=89139 RepID=UPI00374215B3
MSTSTDAVFHRRNKQIQDAIDGQNLKQALQLCEKRIKKGEDTRFLRAWKAHILFRHADEIHRQRGIAETLEICNLEPPTTDLDTLDILHQTLQKLDGHEATMRGIWEKAAKAKPQDLEVQMRWFTYAFEDGDWKSAQKAAMSLQNNFPKSRKYYFWAIFLCYLITVDPSASDADRKLFGTLAYRMISKAAESVPADPKELLSPPRAIQTAEELFLLIKIFESQGRNEEIVKILDSENLGIKSRIVQNDWFFVRAKLLNLEKAGLWTDGLGFARDLLTIPDDEEAAKAALKERDDWGVWELLVSATKKIDNPDTTKQTQEFLEEFIRRFPKSRNAQLALFDLTLWKIQTGVLTNTDLLNACKAYYDRNSNKLFCFGDLRKYVVNLGKDEISDFVDHVLQSADKSSSEKDGVAKINALKLEYCFRLFSDDGTSRDEVEGFVSRCLQAYRQAERPKPDASPSTIENRPADDLCLLAVMALIRISDNWQRSQQNKSPSSVLIRAAGILERLLLDSPHNYQALLLLVRLYLLLGAGSIALKTFSKLSVKQMQNETVGHNLFTRLSTVHPHSAPPIEGAEYKDFNPQSALVQALTFYRNADVTATKSRTNGLNYGSYVNIEGSIDLQKRLRQSICRRMWALDVRRMQRLVGGDPMSRYDELAADTSPLIDQRTFDAFMNCEAPNRPTFEEQLRVGPLPRDRWIKSARETDRLFSLLKKMAAQTPVKLETELPALEELTLSDEGDVDMTPSERDNAKIHLVLLKVVSLLNESKSVKGEELEGLLTQVEDWLTATLESVSSETTAFADTTISLQSGKPSVPSWLYLHKSFTVLETLKAVAQVLSVSSRKSSKSGAKIPKERAERLGELVGKVYEFIKSNTRTLKSHISEPGMLGALIDLVMVGDSDDGGSSELRNELENTLESGSLEVFCGGLMGSWEEGLDGILSVVI